MKKYWLSIFYSLTFNGKNRREIIVRSLFFLVVLFIFSKLWEATQFSDISNQKNMVWYLAITELITLSIPLVQMEIENDIRSGDVVYYLLKPINYLWLKIVDSLGAFLFRFIWLTFLAIPFCLYLTDYIPPILSLITSLTCALLAGIVFIIFHTAIGLTAFRLQDSNPLFWVWQRCSFLFGGLMLPLDFYPYYLKLISYFFPFASLLYAPARLIIESNFNRFLITFGGLIFWGCVAYLLVDRLYMNMLKQLKVNGG